MLPIACSIARRPGLCRGQLKTSHTQQSMLLSPLPPAALQPGCLAPLPLSSVRDPSSRSCLWAVAASTRALVLCGHAVQDLDPPAAPPPAMYWPLASVTGRSGRSRRSACRRKPGSTRMSSACSVQGSGLRDDGDHDDVRLTHCPRLTPAFNMTPGTAQGAAAAGCAIADRRL